MFDAQRQHPVAALANAFDIIKANFITILILIFVGSGGKQGDYTLYWIFGTFIALLIWGGISWLRFRFSVNEGELKIEQGVFVHKKLYLTSDRIQVIDITAGVIQRVFGLVAVEVKTAGSSSKEAKINAISRKEAEKLKKLLRQGSEQQTATVSGEEKANKTYTLDNRDLVIAATTSGRMGVALSVVGAVFSQLDQVVSDEQILRFIETHLPNFTSFSIVAISVVGMVLAAWVLSFVSTIITYYDFEVEVREDDLHISKGLFERKQLTIPFNRIQAVQVKEGILRQPFGYAALVIESAGYGEDQGNSSTLFPLISKQRLRTFIDEVIPEYHVPVDKRVQISKKGLRRYLLRMVWLSLIIIAVVWSMVPYGVYSWLILPLMLLLGYQQYRDAEVKSGEDTIILSWRLLKKTTAIIKKYRVQAVEIKQNPFQTRLDLSDLIVHVASGNQGRSFKVRELLEKQAATYKHWLSNGNNELQQPLETDSYEEDSPSAIE
ncbi:PH domain-containing protein [Fodinibius halophilus]|uniref:PH domain-containing protein n=1 Tax=Fodinibius halophilus TaxID=1736908 RepID=A0A6M1T8F9_9BACT|nr:PH domain-containing protein [Fodinibius halophilus]NGP89735.1 PH domain-containing protein [Fodinibius halophilus]